MPYLSPGETLAERYRIDEEIGRGGYSVVYRAEDLTVGTPVALKLLVPPPATEAVARERMRREALVARDLSHPNVVALHDYHEWEDHAFLTMQLVHGPDLGACVERDGPMSPDQVARVGADISAALEAAHQSGVLHRDVKPQNVLLAADGSARLADFGSARVIDMHSVTRTGGLVGTIAYTAPEVIAGDRGDARADLYGLGVTLYYALTGELPGRASLHLPPFPRAEGFRPADLRPDVPEWLDEVIATLTREDPGLRYPTAGALGEALEAAGKDLAPTTITTEHRGACVLCGEPDPTGVGLCPECLGGGPAGGWADDRLLFVEKRHSRSHWLEIEDWLHGMAADDASEEEIGAVRRGEIPIARVAKEAAPRVARHLRRQGVPVHITHPAHLFARLSDRLTFALLGALILGLAAAQYSLVMVPLTIAFGAAVLVSAVRRQAAGWLTHGVSSPLPADTEQRVRNALGRMKEGTARRILADFVRMARAVRSAEGDELDDADLDRLLRGAEAVAADLEGLDASLALLESREVRSAGGVDGTWLETHARVSRVRDQLVQRLLEALGALARARAAGAEGGHGTELPALARSIERDAELRAEARREVAALLG